MKSSVVIRITILLFLITCVSSKILTAGEVVTVAGNGTDGFSGDGGPAVDAAVSQPFGIVTDAAGRLYVCQVGSHVIRRIDPTTGEITTFAGTGEKGFRPSGPAAETPLNEPYEILVTSSGTVFFVDMQNHVVQRIDLDTGTMQLVAGSGQKGFAGDGGPATAAKLNRPHSIALDAAGFLYICDIGNHRVRRVDLDSGVITTFAGTGERKKTPDGAAIHGTPLNGPRAFSFAAPDTLFLALREGNAIYRMDLGRQTLHHLAGTGKSGYSGHGGPAAKARLSGPKGVTVAQNRDIYFADTESHTVRVIRVATGTIETVIGDGKRGDGPDGDPLRCRLDRPHGVFIDQSTGRLYVGDSNNHRVRMLVIDDTRS